jgi:hypothetical protein
MLSSYFANINWLDLINIWLYFWIHIIFSFFFSIHFFCVKFFKYKIDWKNISLKNLKNNEKARTIASTLKIIFLMENQINKRFNFYSVKII